MGFTPPSEACMCQRHPGTSLCIRRPCRHPPWVSDPRALTPALGNVFLRAQGGQEVRGTTETCSGSLRQAPLLEKRPVLMEPHPVWCLEQSFSGWTEFRFVMQDASRGLPEAGGGWLPMAPRQPLDFLSVRVDLYFYSGIPAKVLFLKRSLLI